MMQEIWKDIQGYEGLYQVSDFGRIKRMESYTKHPTGSKKIVRERILNNNPKSGYVQFTLCNGKTRSNELAHRLVAKHFIPNPDNKKCVNHKDGNPSNNHVNNLEWVTYSENELHSHRILGKVPTLKNLTHYDRGWRDPIVTHGYNIRGSQRKKMYRMLLTGTTIDEVANNKLGVGSFHKLVMVLRKKGATITTKEFESRKLHYRLCV